MFLNEWINEWMNEQTNEWTGKGTNEWMKEVNKEINKHLFVKWINLHSKNHMSVEYHRPGECSLWHWLTFQPEWKSSLRSSQLWVISTCYKSLVVVLIGRGTCDVIALLSVVKAVMLLAGNTVKCDWCVLMSFVSQMSIGLLLVKLVGLSIVCLSYCCRQWVVCKVQVAVGNGSVVFVLS